MEPGMSGCLGPKWQQRIMPMIPTPASETVAWRRVHGVAVQPFGHAARERTGLGLCSGQPAIELGHAGALVKECAPVLGGPSVAGRLLQYDDASPVPGRLVEHGRRG